MSDIIINKFCINDNCDKIACMGNEKNKPLYCITHGLINRKINKIDIINVIEPKICDKDDCINIASHGYDNTWPPELCKTCAETFNGNRINTRKEKSKVNLIKVSKTLTPDKKHIDKVCIICYKSANNKTKDSIKLYCGKCADKINKNLKDEDKFKNTSIKYCIIDDCNKIAVFKKNNNKIYTHCKDHKSYIEIDSNNELESKHKLCDYDDCELIGTFSINNNKTKLYCLQHSKLIEKEKKKENNDENIKIEDVKHKKCIVKECNKRASFNTINSSYNIYCSEHANEINEFNEIHKIINTNSEEFNEIEEKQKAKFINRSTNKLKCKYPNCNTIASFNVKNIKNIKNNKQGDYCKHHSSETMTDVKHKKCEICNDKRPSYNLKGLSPKYCKNCIKKLDDFNKMVDVVHKKCKLCNLTFASDKYDGNCVLCYYWLHPNDKRSVQYSTKERFIFDDLNTLNIELGNKLPEIIRNKTIEGGQSRRRPDGLIKCDNFNIIIEIDENQHKHYDLSCEEIRLNELYTDLKYKPIVFIRFNPDKYINNKNESTMSMFKITMKDGILIKRFNTNSERTLYMYRIQMLYNYIKKYTDMKTINKEVIFEYICYDNY